MPGAARRLVTFFERPKKVNQRNPPLSTGPTGFPALLAEPGGCGTRPLASDSRSRNPPAPLRCSAAAQGEANFKNHTTRPSQREWHPSNVGLRPQNRFSSPSVPPRFSAKIGGRRLRLSERNARVSVAARSFRKIGGSPKGRCGWVSFCLVTSILDKQNKVTCCRAAPGI